VNEASAMVAAATTTAVMEAAEKEVAVNVGRLKKPADRKRATRGRANGRQFPLIISSDWPPLPPWAHPRKLRKGSDEYVCDWGIPCLPR
jgi:hypothetical protein